jgi:hypothetical protein
MKPIGLFAAIAVIAGSLVAPAAAQNTGLTMGMVLEPPHLDPTAGAAAAIRERSREGTPLRERMVRDARNAMDLAGDDFHAEDYAIDVLRGTRIEGWPA